MASVTLRFIATQADVLARSKGHGGSWPHWMDEAGFVCPCAGADVVGQRASAALALARRPAVIKNRSCERWMGKGLRLKSA